MNHVVQNFWSYSWNRQMGLWKRFLKTSASLKYLPIFILSNCFLILLLFIRRKMGTSKIDCGDKISKKTCLFPFSSGKYRLYQLVVRHLLSILIHFQNYNEIALLFFGMLQYLFTKTETGDKIKYCRLPNNTEIQQENVY